MKKLILKHVTNGCFWMNFAVFFKFCTFEKMPENQLLAKKQVTLALMVLFCLFHLLKLARACTSSDKPEKVLCRFTDEDGKLILSINVTVIKNASNPVVFIIKLRAFNVSAS